MKKKMMSVALIAIVFVFASGFTFDVPEKKVIILEDEFNETLTLVITQYNACSGEVVDYVLNVKNWGTVVIYDDFSVHQNFHYNYFNSGGVGQTTGKTYHCTGAGSWNINTNVGSAFAMTQTGNVTCQGMGLLSHFKGDMKIITNANGEVVVTNDNFFEECK